MKKCPFCSAPMREESHKCRACGKALMKDLQIDLHLEGNGRVTMRPYQRHRPHRHRMRLALFAGIVLSLAIAIGGSIELLSASPTGKEAALISSTDSVSNP